MNEGREAEPDQLLYLSRADVEAVAPEPAELIDLVENAFAAVGRGEIAMPEGPALEPRARRFVPAPLRNAEDGDVEPSSVRRTMRR